MAHFLWEGFVHLLRNTVSARFDALHPHKAKSMNNAG